MEEKVRIDKYLWAIRIFKTRAIASESIKKGKVKMNGEVVKASKIVKPGDLYSIRISPLITKVIEVVTPLEKRASFPLVAPFFKDHSPIVEQLKKLEGDFVIPFGKRERGSGRPTKKDGRNIRKFNA